MKEGKQWGKKERKKRKAKTKYNDENKEGNQWKKKEGNKKNKGKYRNRWKSEER